MDAEWTLMDVQRGFFAIPEEDASMLPSLPPLPTPPAPARCTCTASRPALISAMPFRYSLPAAAYVPRRPSCADRSPRDGAYFAQLTENT